MRMVVASCSVIYTGRGDTNLPRATRAILVKGDGAVSIHSDFGNKPLNYMGKGCVHTISNLADGTLVWSFDTRKESIQILLHEVISDADHVLEELEPGLIRDGTEPQLQQWLSEHPETFGLGWSTVQREYPTGAGPVDLFVRDAEDLPVLVEVKRIATSASVYQLNRYLASINENLPEGEPSYRGMIAAIEFRPKTIELSDKHGIPRVQVTKSDFMTETEAQPEAVPVETESNRAEATS